MTNPTPSRGESDPPITVKNSFIRWGDRLIVADSSEYDPNDSETTHATPSDLLYVLAMGHEAIDAALDKMFMRSIELNPGAHIMQPSLFALRLGFDEAKVLTDIGQDNNTSVHSHPHELQPEFLPYWDAVVEGTPYLPEVRSRIGKSASEAAWLTVSLPEPGMTPYLRYDDPESPTYIQKTSD